MRKCQPVLDKPDKTEKNIAYECLLCLRILTQLDLNLASIRKCQLVLDKPKKLKRDKLWRILLPRQCR
jgi:hypothetical protein